MSVAYNQVISSLSPPLPNEIVTRLLDEYKDIKVNFAFRRFRPNQLSGGRFAECVVRLLQHLHSSSYTPFGTQLRNIDALFSQVESNTALEDSMRFYIPRLTRVLLDVRNRRDVAHVGGNVSPNYSDSVFVSHCVDWVLTEIVRVYFQCSIDNANKIVESLNETQIPLIADVDGFMRVQNTDLKNDKKVLAILYHKNPYHVRDDDLLRWLRYSNPSVFKKSILKKLDEDALIHYDGRLCSLLPKGIMYVEKNIPLEIVI